MLSLLAALIPTLGGLFVAGSVLIQQSRAAHEHRVRSRISPRLEANHQRLLARARAHDLTYDEVSAKQEEYERELLALNGIHARRPTYRDVDIAMNMAVPLMPARERLHQWILLTTSTLSLILLAIDQL
ncbi:hypothetical protein QWJ90_01380 [Microbacterium oryzae]|uniref:hypothetical protein n=1 Tax=Microbacterium oryzae TaxID=743009 RepID=UPI0025B05D06|nr:hypothetical protein [Microbacterium oryzae]MDN3309574.1 hypothetical protein [Microbacterium oryzae]